MDRNAEITPISPGGSGTVSSICQVDDEQTAAVECATSSYRRSYRKCVFISSQVLSVDPFAIVLTR